MNIRDWLLKCAKDEIFSYDMADFEQDCDEILKDYAEAEDPAVECTNRNRLWNSLREWQRDKEYLSSLNLHRVIAKHVRMSCRAVRSDASLEKFVTIESARLDGLADEIAEAIRNTWKVRAPFDPDKVPAKFSEEFSFCSLDLFHLGLEDSELIGYPPTNLDFLELMKHEHEQGEKFADLDGNDVDPKIEWNIVMKGTVWNIPGAGCEPTTDIKKRDYKQSLEVYIEKAKDIFANAHASCTLIEAEVAALRLWTGPMHRKYAQVLRHPPRHSCPYVTTLHAINSGITKLARIWPLPPSRKVYRGYKNLKLEDLRKNDFNCVGGVEKCVLATSEDFSIAVDYSMNKSKDGAFVLEIDVGQVNRGADVSWLSQFPHEKEILFNALSSVEFVSSPQQRYIAGRGTILVYQVCVSANVKGKTLEEFLKLRKDLHLNMYREARRMISMRKEGSRYSLIKDLGAECMKHCDEMFNKADAADVGIFNTRTQEYVSLEDAAIMLPSRSFEFMDLALRWFETHTADPAEVDRLEDWQLQALRTCFKFNERRPQVTTIVLNQGRVHVESLFWGGLSRFSFDDLEIVYSMAKLLSLNPELASLEIKRISSKAELFVKFCSEFGHFWPRLHVNGFYLAMYGITTLQQLELRNLDNEMATMIAPALLIHPPFALASLSLCGSPIACTGAECLGRAFTGLQRLRHVDLRSCRIASRGCTGISQNLSALAELENLNLAHNEVSDYGFKVLADAICTLRLERLKLVDMRYNDIKWPSAQCEPLYVKGDPSHMVCKLSTRAAVTFVAWSPWGDQIASALHDMTIIIWDAKTGDKVSMLTGHTSGVLSVTWSAGGSQIASASEDKTIIIWDATTGEQVATLKGHTRYVTSVVWRPVGAEIASGSYDKAIIIWNAVTGEQVSTLKGHTHWVTNLAWSPSGDDIASASNDGTVIIWDAKTGDKVLMLKGHTKKVTSVSWHLGGDQIASGSDDGTIIIWGAKAGERVSTLKGHTSHVTSVAWHPGGDQIASGSGNGIIIIWEAKTCEKVLTFKGHTAEVTSVAWCPRDYLIASASVDKTIIIWHTTREKAGDQVPTIKGQNDDVKVVTWNPDGTQIATASNDATIMIWNTANGRHDCTPTGGNQIVSRGYGSGNSEYFFDNPGEVIISDANIGDQVTVLKGHAKTVTVNRVAWRHGGGKIASGSCDETIIIWDAKTRAQVQTLNGHTSNVNIVAWRPGGDQIASGSADQTVIIWDAKTGEQISTLKGHTSWVQSVAWRPGGDQIVSGGYGAGDYPGDTSAPGEIIIWDAKTGDRVSTLKGHTAAVTSVVWRPGGDQIASGSADKTIIIWDAKTGEQITTLKGHSSAVTSVAWRPGGDQIASGSYKEIIIWDVKTGDKISTLNGHSDWVQSVAWRPERPGHPGGDQIVSGGYGAVEYRGDPSAPGEIIIWDAKNGEQISTLKGHTSAVTSVAWRPGSPGHPGGDQIASGSWDHDNTVIIWDAKTGEQVSSLKGHTNGVHSVAWRPGGDRIASASADTTIIIWDIWLGE